MSSTEATRAVFDKWWACMEAGDIDGMEQLLAPDFRGQVPGGWVGKEQSGVQARFFKDQLVNWMSYEPPIVLVDGEHAVAVTVSHGKLKNGKDYNNRYAFYHRVKDGLIVETRTHADTLHVAQVMGEELAEFRRSLEKN